MLIGSHVSLKGNKMLLGSVEEAASYGSDVFMVYTGAPQNTRRKAIDTFRIEEAHQLMKEKDIKLFTVHAPYIVNLANTTKEGYHEFAIEFLQEEIRRTDAIGAHQITLHPGAHVGAGLEVGMKQLIHGLNEVVNPDVDVQIALETMAGKGTEIGRTFEELAQIIDGVTHNDKLSITFDTCHVFDAGYNIKDDFDGVLNEFDKIIGLDFLKVIHLNDSRNEQGSHKDRHANIGQGNIGFDALNYIAHHPQLKGLPIIMETPWVEVNDKVKVPPYKYEIEMLRSGEYNPHLMEDIKEQK